MVDLNRDLFVLEEELLFPANTQVAVFVSMDVGDFFALDSVTLKIDQKEVANYLYTPREAEALLKGGVHRVYLGNLKVGEHELVALFSGKGPQRARLPARCDAEIREGHRRQVSRAQDQRPAAQAAAGVRDQGLGIVARRDAIPALIVVACRARGARARARHAAAERKDPEKLPATRIRDLHYGDVLFYLYQEQDFEAITRLNAYEHWQLLAEPPGGIAAAARRPVPVARSAQRGGRSASSRC